MAEERLRFVVLANRAAGSMAELCREFGISRQTGYTWLARYRQGGASNVFERSRRPLSSPRQVAAEVEEAVVELRNQWPDWGAKKLHRQLEQRRPELARISVSTVHRILLRNELVGEAERHRPALERFERSRPNELWQMDFKGPQGFNQAIGPLSVLDDHSRYLLVLKQLPSTQMEGVRRTLQETFEQVGLPEGLLVDHGTPWWNGAGVWGWTELTVWIMRQGIRVALSGFRHPQTQGKVERMHGALQAALRKRAWAGDGQVWLDAFRAEYNHVRPHEALGMQTPDTRWKPSGRPFQPQPPEWQYPASMQVLRLGGDGQLGWRGRRWEISRALRRQRVGLEMFADRALVYFCNTPLRELNLATSQSIALPIDAIRSLQC